MILSNVNIGTGPSAGDGDPLRSAFSTINTNFQYIVNNVNALTNSVTTVAGRTGNIVLTINDIVGLSTTYAAQANITASNVAMKGYVDAKIAANIAGLVNSAPEALDTLYELSAALANNANYATTITNIIGSTNSNVSLANTTMKNYVDGQITAANSAPAASNTAMKNYVDGQITAANSGVTSANLGMKGYVDNGIISANLGVIGYINSQVNAANVAWQANALLQQATINTFSGSFASLAANAAAQETQINDLEINVALHSSQIAIINANVSAANVGMLGYVNQTNVAMKGYVDNITSAWQANALTQQGSLNTLSSAFTNLAANAASQQTLIYSLQTSVANIQVDLADAYGDSNVAAYLTTYSGNLSAKFANITGQPGTGLHSLKVGVPGGPEFAKKIASFHSNTNSDSWIAVHNLSSGNAATSGFLALSDLGDNGYNNLFLGMVSSTFNTATFKPLDGAVLNPGGNLVISVGSTSNLVTNAKSISFYTDGGTAKSLSIEHNLDDLSANVVLGANVNLVFNNGGVTGNLIPTANVTYSLGDATHQWKELWISGNTIYIGGAQLSVSGGVINTSLPIAGNIQTSNLIITGANISFSNGAYIEETEIVGNPGYYGLALNSSDDGVVGINALDTNSVIATSVIASNSSVNINTSDSSNVLLTHTWTFNNTGDLNIPGNIIVGNGAINFVASSSGDGNGFSTIEIRPDDVYTSSENYLIIDPTSPNHIHIRAGGTQDNSQAELYLGGENSYFKVNNGADPDVSIAANSYVWSYGVDGSLTFPDSTVQSTAWTGFTANGTNWSGTAPVTVEEAIDRLAILLKTLNSGTGA